MFSEKNILPNLKGMKKNIMDNLYIMDKDGNKVKVEPKNKKGK